MIRSGVALAPGRLAGAYPGLCPARLGPVPTFAQLSGPTLVRLIGCPDTGAGQASKGFSAEAPRLGGEAGRRLPPRLRGR